MKRSRLDVVVGVKQRVEERRFEAFADARRLAQAALADVERAAAAAQGQASRSGSADLWVLEEAARTRARTELVTAQETLERSRRTESRLQEDWMTARRATEVVRRVATARREALLREHERRSEREQDELGSLRHRQASTAAPGRQATGTRGRTP